jgi:hypothetical protein
VNAIHRDVLDNSLNSSCYREAPKCNNEFALIVVLHHYNVTFGIGEDVHH